MQKVTETFSHVHDFCSMKIVFNRRLVSCVIAALAFGSGSHTDEFFILSPLVMLSPQKILQCLHHSVGEICLINDCKKCILGDPSDIHTKLIEVTKLLLSLRFESTLMFRHLRSPVSK